ncbi:unnamed protein product [Caenorhabditis bovis]|uniref:Dynein light intermediate chain n=1 Tax=Caenorhabditis bovis TaxID=2654633 RepID=A0A8S1F5J0_9PELO|nr:unnamed protein product [Caenorhabditis bovis]
MVAASVDVDDSANTILPVSVSSGDDETGIWREVLASKKVNWNQGSTVILMGENRAGKSSLLGRLNKNEKEQKHESLLEYQVIHIQNDARDSSYAYQLGTAGANLNPSEMLHIPVWTLDGSEKCASLLQHALPSNPSKAIFVLAASIDNPNLIHSLKRWANVCTEQAQKNFDKKDLKEGREQQERWWQEYVDPVESQMSSSVVGNFADVTNLLPLDQGTLSENCGMTFIVVITKADLAKDLTDQQFGRIMIHLRKFCLALGATLIFTSANTGKNVLLLQKYLLHRSFGIAFTNAAQVIERDGIFIPAGWDGDKRIEMIKETIPELDMALEPTREKPRPQTKEHLIEAENDQEFLKKLSEVLLLTAPAPAPTRKVAPDEPADSPLANFFSNLLKDKPARTSSPIASQPIEATAAQLDRILRSTSSTRPQQQNSDLDA